MIHQLIFASPKPGMTEAQFLAYWIDVHAERYARKIPQIRRYRIDSRIPCSAETSPRLCTGVAEIWLDDETDQLASLQSPEFIEGARRDEPTWAAFWRTLVLDTDEFAVAETASARDSGGVKLFLIVKRRPGMALATFRRACLGPNAEESRAVPGLRRHVQSHVRDAAYGIGEAPLDAALQLWFDDAESLEAALASPEYARFAADLDELVDSSHVHRFAASETWIIGPTPRSASSRARFLGSVKAGDVTVARVLLSEGANPSVRDDESGLTALMIAAGRADAPMVELLIGAGADVFATDARTGATALHKACQGGSVEVVASLLAAGAPIDATVATTGHTPIIEATWYKHPGIVRLLLDRGAGINITTHYGFSLKDHLEYALKANALGREKFVEISRQVAERRESDAARASHHALMVAVKAGDAAAARTLIAEGVDVDERHPVVNGFEDGHTALLVAARDGRTEIVKLLLDAGANVNATEPTFGAVPLHKAVYNGHADITRILAARPDADLDYQGPTNGYSPIHDAIWHGYEECARILLESGARLDLRGHDGKRPVDFAREVFGPRHALVIDIEARMNVLRG